MKRIRIFALALVLLAPMTAPCAAGEDSRAQAAIAKLKALKLDGVELTSLTVEADKVRMEGQAASDAKISILLKTIEDNIGSVTLQDVSSIRDGSRRFNHFQILVAPYADDAHPPAPAAGEGR